MPVVSYRTGGIPEVVQDGATAILVELFNHEQLANAIIHLIENPDFARTMGGRGAQHIREKFAWKKTAATLLENIRKLKTQKP